MFGLPSLRLRGFYLAVSTLAAQFFVQWALTKFTWFSNDNASGVVNAPPVQIVRLPLRHAGIAATCSRWRWSTVVTFLAVRLVAVADGQELHRRPRQRDSPRR